MTFHGGFGVSAADEWILQLWTEFSSWLSTPRRSTTCIIVMYDRVAENFARYLLDIDRMGGYVYRAYVYRFVFAVWTSRYHRGYDYNE